MHQVADRPLSRTMAAHARLMLATASETKRLTIHTTAWSALLLAGKASSSKPNGAPSIGLNHHQPLSAVLLLCISASRLSTENPSGTLMS